MRFLVIGNAVEERVIRAETFNQRRHIGGVGAIMARELALSGDQGDDVTFLTTGAPELSRKAIRDRMSAYGIETIVSRGHPPQTQRAVARISTRNGNPVGASGNWPTMPSLEREVRDLAPKHDWTIVTANLASKELRAAAETSQNIAVNATSKYYVTRIPVVTHPRVVTMNNMEAIAINRRLKAKDHSGLRMMLGAQTLMVSEGAEGLRIHQEGQQTLKLRAPAAPPNTDFIGAGDSATVGLVYAIAHNLDLADTIRVFIQSLTLRNANDYKTAARKAPTPA